MATIREYFDTDSKVLSIHTDWTFSDKTTGAPLGTIVAKVALNTEANAKYWYFFVPGDVDLESCVLTTLSHPDTRACQLGHGADGTILKVGLHGYSEQQISETLVFTSRIYLYVDAVTSLEMRRHIADLGIASGFDIVVRDQEYARTRSEYEHPLAFIAHDSRDKDDLVRELAQEMIQMMCPVWYDEYSLSVGDSLREKIERGLREVRKCVVILSPNFLTNKGWGKAEFDSVFTREILEEESVILPVWHNVNARDVYDYSPRLADKVGIPTTVGVKELASRLCSVIRRPTP